MRLTVRTMATTLVLGFAVYFATRGVWWTPVQPQAPLLVVAAILLYLATMVTIVLAGIERRLRLPLWCGVLAILATVAIPHLATTALAPVDRTAPFATWFIGGVGLIAVVCIVRRRFVFGWLSLVILIVSACWHMSVAQAFTLGLVGSITWVGVAQLLVLYWDRTIRDTERLADIQQAVSAWHATQQVRQRERRLRVQFALEVAGPVLSRTISTHGMLTGEEREQARLAEGRLRDELRGAVLLNDAVRAAIGEARRRGVAVTVFDENGLEGLPEERREEIRAELAQIIADANSGRVIIRTGRDERVAVTVVGRAAAGAGPEEDDVDLWYEIPR
ncbi:MAG: hypothetical protein WA971_01765 [Microbacterium sp.]